jgi:hypothetical protein
MVGVHRLLTEVGAPAFLRQVESQHELLDLAGTRGEARSVATTQEPLFSSTRRDATLSEATRARSGRDTSILRNASRAAVAIPCPSRSGRSST